MPDVLTPMGAAERILEDITTDAEKLEAMLSVDIMDMTDYCAGNRVLNRIYRTPVCGDWDEIHDLFSTKLYEPLDFEIEPAPRCADNSSDIHMIAHVGLLVKCYTPEDE